MCMLLTHIISWSSNRVWLCSRWFFFFFFFNFLSYWNNELNRDKKNVLKYLFFFCVCCLLYYHNLIFCYAIQDRTEILKVHENGMLRSRTLEINCDWYFVFLKSVRVSLSLSLSFSQSQIHGTRSYQPSKYWFWFLIPLNECVVFYLLGYCFVADFSSSLFGRMEIREKLMKVMLVNWNEFGFTMTVQTNRTRNHTFIRHTFSLGYESGYIEMLLSATDPILIPPKTMRFHSSL